MPVIENNRIASDPWIYLEASDSVAGRSMVIVPASELDTKLASWPAGHRGLGVDLPNDVPAEAIATHLARLDIVTVNFPAFGDGRAFSQARSLRHVHRFGGTIRARGKYLPDQYAMLLQCGVDSFEVDDRFTLQQWVTQVKAIPASYQRDYADGTAWVTRRPDEAAAWAEQPHHG